MLAPFASLSSRVSITLLLHRHQCLPLSLVVYETVTDTVHPVDLGQVGVVHVDVVLHVLHLATVGAAVAVVPHQRPLLAEGRLRNLVPAVRVLDAPAAVDEEAQVDEEEAEEEDDEEDSLGVGLAAGVVRGRGVGGHLYNSKYSAMTVFKMILKL